MISPTLKFESTIYKLEFSIKSVTTGESILTKIFNTDSENTIVKELQRELYMDWRYLPLEVNNAAWQVSIDHALYATMREDILQGKGVKPVVRFYKFSPEAVVLGHEEAMTEFNRELCDREGCMYTTRLTGGGTVYFTPDDLHVSFIYPTPNSQISLKKEFAENTGRVAAAIWRLVPNREMKIGHTGTAIRLDGKIIYGSAMVRGLDGSSLYQGTVYVNNNWEKASRYLNIDLSKLVDQFRNLSRLSDFKNSEELARKIQSGILSQLQHEEDQLSTKEKTLAEEFYKTLYSNRERLAGGKRKAGSCFLPPTEADETYFTETLTN